MPALEPGVIYPREVVSPVGLPSSWVAVEEAYGPASQYAGQTFVRYRSRNGKHKNVSSIRSVILKDAKDRGITSRRALREFRDAIKKAAETEENGVECNTCEGVEAAARQSVLTPLQDLAASQPLGPSVNITCLEANKDEEDAMYQSPLKDKFGSLTPVEISLGCIIAEGDSISRVNEAKTHMSDDSSECDQSFESPKSVKDCFADETTATSDDRVKRKKTMEQLGASEYRECDELVVGEVCLKRGLCEHTVGEEVSVAGALGDSTTADLEELATRVRLWLEKRHLIKAARLVVVLHRNRPFQGSAAASTSNLDKICGLYYERPSSYEGHLCYQKVSISPSSLGCSPLHIFWSVTCGGWKIGPLDDKKAGMAFCMGNAQLSLHSSEPWMLLKDAC